MFQLWFNCCHSWKGGQKSFIKQDLDAAEYLSEYSKVLKTFWTVGLVRRSFCSVRLTTSFFCRSTFCSLTVSSQPAGGSCKFQTLQRYNHPNEKQRNHQHFWVTASTEVPAFMLMCTFKMCIYTKMLTLLRQPDYFSFYHFVIQKLLIGAFHKIDF